MLSPNYLGDDAYSLAAVPYIRITNGERFVASVQEGVKFSAIDGNRFRAGPRASVEFSRQEDGGSTFRIAGERTSDLIGLGDIDTSLSFGGFAELDFGNFTASANLGQAVTGHEGLSGELAVNYSGTVRRRGPPIIYSLGPKLNFADDTYQNAFFGINAVQSGASGLSEFEASGGVVSYGASATVIVPLNDKIATTLIGSYSRLTGDAARSPLVEERGSNDQGFLGLVMTYSFN
ncbi:MipA/OmpV family protein [Sphingomonadaceae bacterium]|nr:MipA/OmpV family protein [Sphingomonadaceae bacterium]